MSRSSLEQIPSEAKAWLDQELKDRGFAGYDDLEQLLNIKLAEHGYELSISRAALGRYGKAKKDAQQQLLRSIEMAKSLNEISEDEADALGMANTAFAQSTLLDLQMKAQELADLDPKQLSAKTTLITKLIHCAADVARASTSQKKWANEINTRIRKAQDDATRIGKKGGMSAGNIDLLRQAIGRARL